MSSTTYNFQEIDLSQYTNGTAEQKKAVIDLVRKICETTGCFYVRTSAERESVDQKTTDTVLDASRRFFHLPLTTKMQYKIERKMARGYYPLHSDNVNAFMGRIAFSNDPVESFCFGPMNVDQLRSQNPTMSDYYPDNIWPENEVPGFRKAVENCYTKMQNCAITLSRLLAECLETGQGGDAEFFQKCCRLGAHNFNLNFYPPLTERNEIRPGQDRFPRHKDANLFTLYAIDGTTDALMAKDGRYGIMKAVNPKPNTLIVMLGEVMEHFTDSEWVACEHMVQWPPAGQPILERSSIGLFFKPSLETTLSCVPTRYRRDQSQLKRQPITFKQFFDEKIAGMMKILYLVRAPKQ